MVQGVDVRARFEVDDAALSRLHRQAFGTGDGPDQPWADRLGRHSLTWVGAFAGPTLIGFVNVCGDGGSHAFILDTAVAPDFRRRGVGRALLDVATAEAARAGVVWLHVDYEPELRSFYQACGFGVTEAGLLRLAE